MWSVSFWKATAERVVTAFAVALISTLVVGGELLDVTQIRWGQALGIAAGAALLSLLKGLIAGTGIVGPKGSPSLVKDPAAAGYPPLAAAERLAPPTNITLRPGPDAEPTTRTTGTGGYPGGSITPPD